MTPYRCVAMPKADAKRLREVECDDFGLLIKRIRNADTYPCRHCLREASAETGMLLLAYRTREPAGVYGHATAIFLCEAACDRFADENMLPPIVRNRVVSFRAFGADGGMIYDANELVFEGEHDAALDRMLDRAEVAYVNVHTAKAGCFLCHVERGDRGTGNSGL